MEASYPSPLLAIVNADMPFFSKADICNLLVALRKVSRADIPLGQTDTLKVAALCRGCVKTPSSV